MHFNIAPGDKDGPRLATNAIGSEYGLLLIQTPLDGSGWHQLCGPGGRLVEGGLPGDGYELNPIDVFSSKFVNDGQLPSTGASPLGPEHQIDGLLLVAERERRSVGKRKDEIGGGGTLNLGCLGGRPSR